MDTYHMETHLGSGREEEGHMSRLLAHAKTQRAQQRHQTTAGALVLQFAACQTHIDILDPGVGVGGRACEHEVICHQNAICNCKMREGNKKKMAVRRV